MTIKKAGKRRTVLSLDDEEIRVLSKLVDLGFDDFFQNYCAGNSRLKVSKIAAKFFDELQAFKLRALI